MGPSGAEPIVSDYLCESFRSVIRVSHSGMQRFTSEIFNPARVISWLRDRGMQQQSSSISRGLLALRLCQRGRLWGLVGVVAIALSGCSLAMFETPSAQVPRLVYSILSDPKTYNYALSQESPNIFGLTYEGLITENGLTGEVEPALAESWTVSDDGLSVVYTLRENLKWSDGEPLTVDDVIFSYNEIFLNEEIPSNVKDSLRVGIEGKLPTVRKLDERRVEFRVPEPFAPFLRSTGLAIMPKHALEQTLKERDADGNLRFLSTWGTNTDPKTVVFNGPYALSRYIPSERVVFERNPHYWRQDDQGNPQPYIDQIVWQVVESTDNSIVQFRSGGLDLIGVTPDSFALLKREEDRGNFTIYNGGPAPGTTFLTFNLNKGSRNGKPLVDPIKSRWFNTLEFRQAVAYGIDRQTMLNNIYQGLGAPQDSPISVQSPYYLSPEEGLISYDYNPEKAKELLLSAGFQYTADNRLVDAEGNPVRFTLLTNAGNKIREALCAQIKQNLEKIGMIVDFQPISFQALVDKLSDSLDWDAHVIGFTGGVEPNGGANIWLPDGALHAFNQKPVSGQEPIEGWEVADWEAKIGQLYVQGAQELDETKRKAIYAETQRLAQEYLPFIHLVNPLSLSAVRDRVQGVQYSALGGALWNIHEITLTDE